MDIVMRESFNDSIDHLWETIRDFGGLGRYYAPAVHCRVEGAGVGAKRFVTLRTADGKDAFVVERLEELDERAKRLAYSIPDASGFPIKDGYLGVMQLRALGDGRCELEWGARVEPDMGASEDDTREFIRVVYTTAFEGLRNFMVANSGLQTLFLAITDAAREANDRGSMEEDK